VSKLPQVSGTRLVRALGRAGFREVHRRGSHVMLVHRSDATRIAVVPMHKGKTLPPGTLRAILKGARVALEELRALL
jgi:predicted RNA binding protein YcfA (HicA-like mRNA interferase family)